MGHRDQQSESVSVDRRDKQNWFSVRWSVCKAKWFPRRKRMNSIKRTFILPWMSFERSSLASCNNNRHPPRRRPVGNRQGNAQLGMNVWIVLVQSADDSVSPVLHLLVLWDSRKGCGQMAPAVVNDAGWMTRSEGSKSTRRRESHNNRLPYDDHVTSKQGSLMYFEENKRRPSKRGEQQQLKMIKETRETREKNH